MKKGLQGKALDTTIQLANGARKHADSIEVMKEGRKKEINQIASWRTPSVDATGRAKIKVVPHHARDSDAVAKALRDNLSGLRAKFGAQHDVTVEYEKLSGQIALVFAPKPLSPRLNRNNVPLVPEVSKNVFEEVINHFLNRYEQVKNLGPASTGVENLSIHQDWLQYERELQHFALIYELIAEKAARGVSPATIKEDLTAIINDNKIGGRFIKGEYKESRPMPGTFFGKVPIALVYLDMVNSLADIPNEKLIPQFKKMQAQLDALEKQEPLPAPVETLNFLSGRSLSARQEDRVSPSQLMEQQEDDLYGPSGPFTL